MRTSCLVLAAALVAPATAHATPPKARCHMIDDPRGDATVRDLPGTAGLGGAEVDITTADLAVGRKLMTFVARLPAGADEGVWRLAFTVRGVRAEVDAVLGPGGSGDYSARFGGGPSQRVQGSATRGELRVAVPLSVFKGLVHRGAALYHVILEANDATAATGRDGYVFVDHALAGIVTVDAPSGC